MRERVRAPMCVHTCIIRIHYRDHIRIPPTPPLQTTHERPHTALATTPYVGEPVYDMYADYFGSPAFLDQPVSRAFAGAAPYRTVGQRNETIVKGLESGLQTLYMLHELDEAAAKIAAGDTSAAKGAPHNVDETWAIYAGMKPDCSLWGASHRRGREFGTMKDCDTR